MLTRGAHWRRYTTDASTGDGFPITRDYWSSDMSGWARIIEGNTYYKVRLNMIESTMRSLKKFDQRCGNWGIIKPW